MYRIAIPVLFATAVIFGLISSTPTYTAAQPASPTPAEPALVPPCDDDPNDADVRPRGEDVAVVRPAAISATPAAETSATATPAFEDDHELYLVVITLPPRGCMPFHALGNQKDGAIVMIVQQGAVEYLWRPADAGSTPEVSRGDSHRNFSGSVPANTPMTLYPGDWITLDREVQFTYRNVGGESAVILKAVWAVPSGGGCGGGCK